MNEDSFSTTSFRVLALAAVLGLSGCDTPGKTGEMSRFDIARASPEDVADALERDGRVVLSGVLFETGSARLSPEGRDAAARLAGALERNPNLRVALVGHTDSVGSFNSNLDLSRRRAEAMTRELVRSRGIAQDRIAPVGIGPLAPVASNDTEDGRAMNRRVEAVLIN